jgi:hypothetical protein
MKSLLVDNASVRVADAQFEAGAQKLSYIGRTVHGKLNESDQTREGQQSKAVDPI